MFSLKEWILVRISVFFLRWHIWHFCISYRCLSSNSFKVKLSPTTLHTMKYYTKDHYIYVVHNRHFGILGSANIIFLTCNIYCWFDKKLVNSLVFDWFSIFFCISKLNFRNHFLMIWNTRINKIFVVVLYLQRL